MEIKATKIEALREMLEDYKQKHGEIVKEQQDTQNCSVCTIGCSGRCDGSGSGGICWKNSNYR